MAALRATAVAVENNQFESLVHAEMETELQALSELELPSEDGIPLETNWHRVEMNLLIDSIHYLWRDRQDYFAGGNMFIYFSLLQALRRDYRGPDFFVVKGVDGTHDRESWVVWNENGKYPHVIIELASRSTIHIDLSTKKELYASTFRTPEYFCYDPNSLRLYGWELQKDEYVALEPNEHGWLWSQELNVWVGTWQGEFQRIVTTWLRFYTLEGQLIFTPGEAAIQRAEAEAQRAEAEAQRAEAAEKEIARLRALLQKSD